MFRPCCRLPTDLLDNNETLLRYYQTCVRVVFMSSDHTSYLLSSSMAIWRYPRKRMLDRIFVFGHYKTPITLILRIVTTSAIFFHRTCPSSTSITDKTDFTTITCGRLDVSRSSQYLTTRFRVATGREKRSSSCECQIVRSPEHRVPFENRRIKEHESFSECRSLPSVVCRG